jgi:hypothetical protein
MRFSKSPGRNEKSNAKNDDTIFDQAIASADVSVIEGEVTVSIASLQTSSSKESYTGELTFSILELYQLIGFVEDRRAKENLREISRLKKLISEIERKISKPGAV